MCHPLLLTLVLSLAACHTPAAGPQATRVTVLPSAAANPFPPARVAKALLAKPAGATHELAGIEKLPNGDLILVDAASHCLRRLHEEPSGLAARVGTRAGKIQNTKGAAVVGQDGTGLEAAFRTLGNLAVAPATGLGYVFELDGSIRQLTPAS